MGQNCGRWRSFRPCCSSLSCIPPTLYSSFKKSIYWVSVKHFFVLLKLSRFLRSFFCCLHSHLKNIKQTIQHNVSQDILLKWVSRHIFFGSVASFYFEHPHCPEILDNVQNNRAKRDEFLQPSSNNCANHLRHVFQIQMNICTKTTIQRNRCNSLLFRRVKRSLDL